MKVTYSYTNTNTRTSVKSRSLLFIAILLAIFTGELAWAAQPSASQSQADVTVYKTAYCSCCKKWTDQLKQSGLNVDVVIVDETNSVRSRLGVPQELASCHTAVVGNYWVEGHVPVDLVKQLLVDQPADIKGIAVPGMVAGSAGMEAPNPSNYKVLSVNSKGEIATYATRKGHSSPSIR